MFRHKIWNKHYRKNFTAVQCIQNGKHSQVVSVMNNMTQTPYIVKEYRFAKMRNDLQQMVLGEIDYLNGLHTHKNIVSFIKSHTDANQVTSIQLEYLNGGDFFDKHIATDNELLYSIHCISSALKYCHTNDVLHNDVKSENMAIKLCDNKFGFRVMLIDFGGSERWSLKLTECIIDEETGEKIFQNENGVRGTLNFLSPEEIQPGTSISCFKSDIWSLGVTMYQKIANVYLFHGEGKYSKNRDHILRSILHSEITFTDAMTEKFPMSCVLINQMLTRDWKKRPSSKEIHSKSKYVKP